MEDFSFESFAFAANDSMQEHASKKIRCLQKIFYDEFCCPNIFAFHIELGKNIQWILADPAGHILQESSMTDLETLEEIINFAIDHTCTVVTHDKQSACQKLKTIDSNRIFCTMTSSVNRSGLIRLDGQRKFLSHEQLYRYFFGHESDKMNNNHTHTYYILQVFIEGRMHGWW